MYLKASKTLPNASELQFSPLFACEPADFPFLFSYSLISFIRRPLPLLDLISSPNSRAYPPRASLVYTVALSVASSPSRIISNVERIRLRQSSRIIGDRYGRAVVDRRRAKDCFHISSEPPTRCGNGTPFSITCLASHPFFNSSLVHKSMDSMGTEGRCFFQVS
jgi:hypothetical protein